MNSNPLNHRHAEINVLPPTRYAAARRVQVETHANCGDLHIGFDPREGAPLKRGIGGGWSSFDVEATWRLWRSTGADNWQGAPLKVFQTSEGRGWLLGELYGRGARSASIPDYVMDLVSTGDGADQLNGHFLLFWWNAKLREWNVWTDRFGTLHAYAACDGRRAALSTFFPAAAIASRRQLDWAGIAGFFAQGFFPQDRTYFTDVRILLPATHYVYTAAGRLIKQERYWQWSHTPDEKRSYADTVDEFAGLWETVMSEQYGGDGRIAIPLSGGLDSRTTIGPLLAPGAAARSDKLWSYSYGYPNVTVETDIARRVAAAGRLPFQPFTVKPYLSKKLDLVGDSTEGFQDILQCRQAAVVDDKDFNADYLIAAHWGDVWMDTMGLTREPSSDGERVAGHALYKALKNGRRWLLENVSDKHVSDGEGLLREMTRVGLSQLGHLSCPDFRVKAFKTDTWSFRWTMTSLRMFQPAAFPRLPFYDTRLTDFFGTVPSRFMLDRQLQIDYLKRHAPALARITWQAFDANLYRYRHHRSWLLPKRIYKKVRRLAARRSVPQRNWEVQLFDDEGRRALNNWLLRPGLALHQFVAPQRVKELVDSFYGAPLEDGRGYTVPMLLTFSNWLERHA